VRPTVIAVPLAVDHHIVTDRYHQSLLVTAQISHSSQLSLVAIAVVTIIEACHCCCWLLLLLLAVVGTHLGHIISLLWKITGVKIAELN